ncbi:MAG: ATP-binding protein [Legionella sp.]|uniref:ATP-binding protein n=1 Tax=Legionella sp. TaxID=459 RepID=UPI00284E51F9|nr:ATP-binding protein [Legionella sp.]
MLSPNLYMMIGLPGVGKSTWIRNHAGPHNQIVVSSDDYIETIARYQNKTYNEVFKDSVKDAEKYMYDRAAYAVENDFDVIWDQTNLNQKTRMKKLDRFPDYYNKIAVCVFCENKKEWERRLNNRPGKTIPAHIINSMAESYQYPVPGEGFDEIIEYLN